MPEICKKSLISCPVLGGFELFVIGKNFAKDTKMIFQSQKMTGEVVWQEIVVPDKEYLQQVWVIIFSTKIGFSTSLVYRIDLKSIVVGSLF